MTPVQVTVSHMSDAAFLSPQTIAKAKRVIRSKAPAKSKASAKPKSKSPMKSAANKRGRDAVKPRVKTPGSTNEQAEQIAALEQAAVRLRREVTTDPAARRALLKRIAPRATTRRT